ncbi:MAG TPA: hypothetical protein VMN36_11675 [Verrucomicrobiales bacterium]|nr:hypothetical protein [Verrucomicrobiales bacterium]
MTTKERIIRLQTFLKVTPDGIVGPETLTAAEKAAGIFEERAPAPEIVPEAYSVAVSKTSLAKIVFFEVSSKSYYERRLAKPTWPQGGSGVTIGIGYDLGYNTKTQIRQDWRRLVSDRDLDYLKSASGIRGAAAAGVARSLASAGVRISFDAAQTVFFGRTLPRFAALCRKTYPGIELLPPDAQGALVSLVYNRGSALGRSNRRREMVAIRRQVAEKDLPGIAASLRSMKRLWPNLRGLIKRREQEAILVENSQRIYGEDEIVFV